MWRVRGLRFSRSSTARPEWSGRFMSSRIALGHVAARPAPGPRRRCARPRSWKPSSCARSRRMRAKRGVVLDDQQRCAGASAIGVAVVGEARPARLARRGGCGAVGAGGGAAARRRRRVAARRRAAAAPVAARRRSGSVSVKVLPSPGALCTRDARRRAGAPGRARSTGPRPVPPYLRLRGAVGLAEGLEDDVLLRRRRCRCRCRAPRSATRSPAAPARRAARPRRAR